tara:strand:- start:21226 stop:22239 length:1014 start_codon:yes stop_codon:yes gene_type:complete
MPTFSDIETSYVQRYAQDVQHMLQQKTTRLRNMVSQKLDCSGIAEFIDRIGGVTAENKNARFADSPVQAIAHQRRRVTARPYHAGFFVEGFDQRRMNYDVFQPYAEATSMAMARKMDEIIVDAAFGTAYQSESGAMDGATPVLWTTSSTETTLSGKVIGDQFIGVQFAYGSSPDARTKGMVNAGGDYTLSIDKLLRARRILAQNEADQYDEGGNPLYVCVCSQSQIEALLHSQAVQSIDYNNIRALVEGETNFFAGFQFIKYESLPTNVTMTGGDTGEQVLAFHPAGLSLCVWMDPITKIEPRADKSFTPYAYFEMDMGATRIWEEMVVQIDCLKMS